MPMIRAMRLLNAVEAGTTSGAQLQTLLQADPGRLAEFNVLLGMRGQTRRMAASSTAMAAVAASSTAMAAVAASSTAMAAVNANDQAVRIWMLAGTNQVWSNFASVAAVAASSTAMAAVAASSTAMAAVAASSTALRACWGSETALTALRAEPSALTALLASPFKSTVGNDKPSSLTATMLAGKTILLRSRNAGGSDTNRLATKYQNGSAVADHVYQTSTSYSTQMVAFQDIRHSASQYNYNWYGDVVKVD